MGDEHTESRVKKLTKDELIILCQMLGIKTGFSFFQKEADLVDAIFRKDKNEVEKCLSLLSILKASDTDWLRKTFEFELGIRKETSAEKASEILSKENVKTIKKLAGKVEYEEILKKIFPKNLSEIIIGGCSITFILSFYADFAYLAAIVSICALGFVLFTAAYASPLAIRKRITIEHWQFISIAIALIAVSLLLYTLFSKYPEFERKDFISNWAGNVATLMGFLFGAILYFCNERPKLENWWRKHSGKVMWSIIFMVGLGYLYVHYCVISGRVSFEDDMGVEGTIRMRGASETQDGLCYDEPSKFYSDKSDDNKSDYNKITDDKIKELCKTIRTLSSDLTCDDLNQLNELLKNDKLYNELKKKYENDQKLPSYIEDESNILKKNRLMLEVIYPDKIPLKDKSDRFYKNFIKDNKLCATATKNIEGKKVNNFSFRLFSLEEREIVFWITYEEKIYTKIKHITPGEKNIKISIWKKLFEGEWECSTETDCHSDSFKFKIEEKDNAIIKFIKLNGEPPVPFNSNITSFSYDFKRKKFYISDKEYNGELTVDNDKLELTVTLPIINLPIHCCR